MVTKMVTISEKEYKELLEDSKKLYALESGGVDNWEGYSEAMGSMDDEEENDL